LFFVIFFGRPGKIPALINKEGNRCQRREVLNGTGQGIGIAPQQKRK
jgi:hypothetical protein